ncbi:MAG: hypothetical protein ABEJ74_08565 [Haloferacaceae archaeon]
MSEGSSPLVEAARDEFGDRLRAVIRYRIEGERPTSDLLFLRDDLAATHDDVDEYAADLSADYTFESIERRWHERIHGAGSFRATVRVFEEEAELRLHAGLGDGYSVHVDPAALAETVAFLDQLEDVDV